MKNDLTLRLYYVGPDGETLIGGGTGYTWHPGGVAQIRLSTVNTRDAAMLDLTLPAEPVVDGWCTGRVRLWCNADFFPELPFAWYVAAPTDLWTGLARWPGFQPGHGNVLTGRRPV